MELFEEIRRLTSKFKELGDLSEGEAISAKTAQG